MTGLFTLRDYGITVDETESLQGAQIYANFFFSFLKRMPQSNWPFHVIPGFYFPIDLFRHSVAKVAMNLSSLDYVQGFHLANLVLSSASLFLLFRIAFVVTRNRRAAFLTALALALFPQFIGQSQNNPKDILGLFSLLLSLSCLLGSWPLSPTALVMRCIALGISFTSTVLSVFFIPLFFLWDVFFRKDEWIAHGKQKIGLLIGGLIATFLFWPFLWVAPWENGAEVVTRLTNFTFNINETYLGNTVKVSQLPWHYVPLHLLATLPCLFLAALGLNIFWLQKKWPLRDLKALFVLGAVWLGSGLALSFNSDLKYNGMRHFLLLLPAIAILTGTGFEIFLRKWPTRMSTALVTGIYLFSLVQMIRIHPHQAAYLNEAANFLIHEESEKYFEVEYFGHPYLEGSQWLNQHGDPRAEIIVPIFPALANQYLLRKSDSSDAALFFDTSKTRYLMYITRVPGYTPAMSEVENKFEPVFEIRRQKATLLKIYKNTPKEIYP